MSEEKAALGEARLRVRYAETDQMGVVYHSNFIIWFEIGRVELLRQLGFEYRLMEEEDDCHIAVVDVHCRFRAPAQYDDEILVRTQLQQFRSGVLRFTYEVYREAGNTRLAEGDSTHVVVNSKFQRIPVPRKYAEAFRRALPRRIENIAGPAH